MPASAVKLKPAPRPDLTLVAPQDSTVRPPALWRVARIAIALPLLALSVGALLPLAVIPVSSQAVVNARLSRVRAPIAGEALQASFEPGDVVAMNQEILRIRSLSTADRNEKPELVRMKRDLEAQHATVQGQVAAAEQRLAQYEGLLGNYRDRIAAELALQIGEAARERDSALEAAKRLDEKVRRLEQAEKEGILSGSEVAESLERATTGRRLAEARGAAVERLRGQLANIKAGFFTTAADQPRYLALRDEATAEVGNLRQQLDVLARRLKSIEEEVAQADSKLRGTAAVASPVNGLVWGRGVAPGQVVGEGDDLFRVADAESLRVDAWLDRRYGPQLSIGDTALVYLSGLGKQLSGRVTSFQGTSRRRLDEDSSAIDLQPVHPDQYRVTIQLAPGDRNATYIGQGARVLFPGRKASVQAQLYFWLTRL